MLVITYSWPLERERCKSSFVRIGQHLRPIVKKLASSKMWDLAYDSLQGLFLLVFFWFLFGRGPFGGFGRHLILGVRGVLFILGTRETQRSQSVKTPLMQGRNSNCNEETRY